MKPLILRAFQAVFARKPFRSTLCWRGSRSVPKVAITFDDGPNDPVTADVLRILAETGVRSTFFLLGREIVKHREYVEKIVSAGHEVGLHSYDHSPLDIPGQVRATEKELEKHGVSTTLLRPPLGALKLRNIIWSAARGYSTIIWSFDAHDSMRHESKWDGPAPDYGNVLAGDIILMHDDNPVCVRELPALISSLRSRGLEPATVSEVLNG